MVTEQALVSAFADALPETHRAQWLSEPQLAVWVPAMVDEAHAALGPLVDDDLGFASYLGMVVGREPVTAELPRLRVADLYLAYGCSAGATKALEAFDAAFKRDIDLAAARIGSTEVGKSEFRQMVREKLFVSHGDRKPKIVDYAGRGDLRSWVRVTVVRMAIDVARQQGEHRPESFDDAAVGLIASPERDPELDYLQRNFREQFQEALQQGLARLSARERNILRHHALHGLNIDQIGSLYRVHRTTAFRWLEKARNALLTNTREALQSGLHLDKGEVLSIMRLVDGSLDVSIRRLLVSDIETEGSSSGSEQ